MGRIETAMRKDQISGVEPPVSTLSLEGPLAIRSRAGWPLITDPGQRTANEYFGMLRARLMSARSKSAIGTVLVASPQRQDGKTFVSLNLAISLANLQRERILLVDGDLRASGITRMLGLQGKAGLADYLQHAGGFRDSIRQTTFPRLSVVPAGNLSKDHLPAILQGVRWPEFLDAARLDFDLIIVDSVPVCAPIADFELLLQGCDAALLVVRVRKTSREAIEFTAQRT